MPRKKKDKMVIEHADQLPEPERDDGGHADAPGCPTDAQETIGKPGDED